MKRALAVALALLALSASAQTRRFALVIGNDRGAAQSPKLRWAEADAQKVQSVLVELGGFHPSDVRLVTGKSASDARRALDGLEARVIDAAKSGAATLLVVYYSGHADGDVLELDGTEWPFAELTAALERSQAQVRLAFVDSCRSGKWLQRKGGTPGPAFAIDVADRLDSRGYAVVTSSAGDELSQESAEVRGSYFTHYLVSALRGAGDASNDGQVTLGEAYRYAYERTVARTTGTTFGSQHPMYEFRLTGQGEVVLTTPRQGVASATVRSPSPGRVVWLDGQAQRMVAEHEVKAQTPTQLSLAEGTYKVYFLGDGETRSGEVKLEAGAPTQVEIAAFSVEAKRPAVAKGELFDTAWVHQLGVGPRLRRAALDSLFVELGADVWFRAEKRGWQPTARLGFGLGPGQGTTATYGVLGGWLGFGRLFALGPTTARVELLAGYEHLFQGAGHTGGFSGLGVVGVELPLGSGRVVLDAGAGARMFQLVRTGLTVRFDVLLTLGYAWAW